MADVSKIKLKGTIYNFKDAEARELIANLPVPVQFKGTLGEGGTISTLPEATESTIGFAYKIISNETYLDDLCYPDDVVVCNSDPAWVIIHSGDNNYQQKLTHEVNAGAGIKIDNDTQQISLVDPVVPRFKAFKITGNGTDTEFTITHGLNTKDVFIQAYDSTGTTVIVDSIRNSLDTIAITFETAPASATTYRIILLAFEEVTEETTVLYSLPMQLGLELFESNLL